MRSFALTVSCAVAVAAAAPVASAQTVRPDSGARVRLRLHSDPEYVYQGVLLAPVGDSVVVGVPGERALRIARPSVRQMQVGTRGSRTRSTFAGIGIGLVAGAAVGAMVGQATTRPDDFFGPELAAAGATLLGVVGGVTGGIVGYNRVGTRWRDVPLSTRVGLRGARISIAF
ncbi:MAG: hypothetical protein HOQ12_06195 [Gemmatimonadaceae bacterium]|nr:hypothetical protein [Gemmatimonadaceae bacterium]NUQ94284.1 hypothetical protein [Gemmatimonadaceae bacterium]NUR19105.1 hypothetical protein [Gemmatimonadaceae bacterium]